jgi:Spy/CpxP family protein refolding chaperone
MMTKRLNLTDDQAKQVKVIMLSQATSMDSLRSSGGGDPSSMRPGMMAIMKNTDTKLNAILTDDQKKEYEAMKAERRQRQMGGGGGGGSQN